MLCSLRNCFCAAMTSEKIYLASLASWLTTLIIVNPLCQKIRISRKRGQYGIIGGDGYDAECPCEVYIFLTI